MPKKLKKLRIDRIDLVDKGANPDARVVLFKRDATGKTIFTCKTDRCKEVFKQDEDTKSEVVATLWDKFRAVVAEVQAEHPEFTEEESFTRAMSPSKNHAGAVLWRELITAMGKISKKKAASFERYTKYLTKKYEDNEMTTLIEKIKKFDSQAEALDHLTKKLAEDGSDILKFSETQEGAAVLEAIQKIETVVPEPEPVGTVVKSKGFLKLEKLAQELVDKKEAPTFAQAVDQIVTEQPKLFIEAFANEA
ncbi:hypothetical protein MYX82_03785 [Acidobacteria bacterium AH-259-D05]|nr:hypothetical protein [Acidobacteria bacterium AH-259-D05]